MRVAGRDEIVAYANALLEVERWPEFAPPGLQVVGADEVTLLLCGVSSSRALFEHAADVGAEMVLVHHGLFWRNEPLVVDRRQRGRLEALFRGERLARSPTTSPSTRTRRSATPRSSPRGSARRRRGRSAASGSPARSTASSIDELTGARRATRSGGEPLVFAARARRGSGASRSRPAPPATT